VEMPEVEIRPIGESDLDAAAGLIAAAFLDEPGTLGVIKRSPRKRRRILERFFTTQLMLNLRQGVSTCSFLNGELVGVMVLSGPDNNSIPTGEVIRFLLRMMLHVSPAILWRGFTSSLLDEKHRPDRPHYYLETLAVDPQLQRRGIGAALLSYLTDKADREGILVYLSTTDPRNVPLYERHGFRTVSETEQSGVPSYHMERRPMQA